MGNKTILVTGASRGIGLQTARTLKPLSSHLILAASHPESFDPVRSEFGTNTSFYGLDLSSSDEIKFFCSDLSSGIDRLDVLINNCGIYLEKQLEESAVPEIEKQIDVNLRAPILLTQELLTLLEKGENPIVINISSISARLAPAGQSVYSAAKSGISAFSSSIRKELNPLGIRVTVIHPYAVNTWNDPDAERFLRPEDMGGLIRYIIETDINCQIDEVTLSALGKTK